MAMVLKCIQHTSVVAERSIRDLKKKIYDHRILVSTNAYNDKLHGIVDKYNNTCDRTIKIKPSDVKPSNYIDYGVEHNDN